jgi:hypothetical protein
MIFERDVEPIGTNQGRLYPFLEGRYHRLYLRKHRNNLLSIIQFDLIDYTILAGIENRSKELFLPEERDEN